MNQYEIFETWLNKHLALDIVPEVKAVNFNLYESSESEEDFDIQMIGALEYDPDDSDWACDTAFSTGEDLCSVKANDWEDCLQVVTEYIKKYLSQGAYAQKLTCLCAVTVGFVDGDLEVVFEK